jgi:spore maturation protein CgeB
LKYAAWICRPYEPDIYSCTLLNECNHIFFADRSLAEEFAGGGFKNVHFLPLGVNAERITSVLEENKDNLKYDSDLTMMQDIRSRSDMHDSPLSDNSPLREATKGYLEGCIDCQRQLSGLPPMAEKLPDYVKEDMQRHFPPIISGDSIETASHYYDYSFFNPLITYAQRDTHLYNMAACGAFENVNLYSGYSNSGSGILNIHERADYLAQVPLIAGKSRINLVVTNRNWKSAVPQISWDIMASGGFLISNIQSDFYEIFKQTLPVMYENKNDLKNKGIYYLKNEGERERTANELSEEVRDRHTYENRIGEMLGKI